MSTSPYERFTNEELILRDELAIDRTILANERTLLAYGRTGLALIIGGVTFTQFGEYGILLPMGIVLIPLGLVIIIFGYQRYRWMSSSINKVRKRMHPR